MSQGVHVADVAIFYPIATVHANWRNGKEFDEPAQRASDGTFDLAKAVYKGGIDFDFIDHQSLCRAEIVDGVVRVSGLEFRVLLLPPMTTIRTEVAEKKIRAFVAGGGTAVSVGRLPTASPEYGRDDPNIESLMREIFGIDKDEAAPGIRQCENERGGKAIFLPDALDSLAQVPSMITDAAVQDVVSSEKGIFHTHQRTGDTDVYFLFNTVDEARDVSFVFRVCGEPEIWDAFTGQIRVVHRFEREGQTTKVRLRMEPYEGLLLVFVGDVGRPQLLADNLTIVEDVVPCDGGIEIGGFGAAGGKARMLVCHEDKNYRAEVAAGEPPEAISLDGLFSFSLEPTMDNRWGDFRYPPKSEFIGAEARI